MVRFETREGDKRFLRTDKEGKIVGIFHNENSAMDIELEGLFDCTDVGSNTLFDRIRSLG